jgi:hypothetical protein
MIGKFFKLFLLLLLAALLGSSAAAQDASQRFPTDPDTNERQPKNIKEMLIKKKIEQEKKEHEELLERGQEAMEISDQLERSFAQNNQLSTLDKQRLEDLANIVKKIRKEIGAEDDDDDRPEDPDEAENNPTTMQTAFKALQSTTVKLVDELKKMSRFTISAVAIRSSNSLLKIVRFIRGK